MACFTGSDAQAAVAQATLARNALSGYMSGLPQFAGQWDTLEKTYNLLLEGLQGGLPSFISPGSVCDAAMGLERDYFNLGETVGRTLGTANPVPVPTNPSVVGVTRSLFNTVLTLGVAFIAGYWLYRWATAPESYPSHLAPRYAGGHRRLAHR